MKILDPQCAVLTNAEVFSFMQAHPPRKADPQVGGYPVTDMNGLWSVQRELREYVETITPQLVSYPDPPSKYMRTLLQRLKRFNLTKPEVLMMINLGVGVKKSPAGGEKEDGDIQGGVEVEPMENGEGDLLDKVERHINSAEAGHGSRVNGRGDTDTPMQDEQEDDPDISVLNTIVEEMYDRFTDAEVNEILKTCGEVLGNSQTGNDAVDMQDG